MGGVGLWLTISGIKSATFPHMLVAQPGLFDVWHDWNSRWAIAC